jgi:hypothetical protein
VKLKLIVAMGLVLSTVSQTPAKAEEAQATSSEAHPVKKFFQDGAYVVASPLRLTSRDIPIAIGVTALLGGAFALDRTTHDDLFPFVTSGSADTLRKYGDIAQYSGPIFGAFFAIHGWAADDPQSQKTAALAFESFLWAGAIELSAKAIVGRNRPTVTTDPFTFSPGQTDGSFPLWPHDRGFRGGDGVRRTISEMGGRGAGLRRGISRWVLPPLRQPALGKRRGRGRAFGLRSFSSLAQAL